MWVGGWMGGLFEGVFPEARTGFEVDVGGTNEIGKISGGLTAVFGL